MAEPDQISGLARGSDGRIKELWLGGSRSVPEAVARRELQRRYLS